MAISKQQLSIIRQNSDAIRSYIYARCNVCDADMPWEGGNVEWIVGKPWDLDETVQEAILEICALDISLEDLAEATNELKLRCPNCGNDWESGRLVSHDSTDELKEQYKPGMKLIKIKLLIDGRWNLKELSEVTNCYAQLYGFAYSLSPDLSSDKQKEIDHVYGRVQWQGRNRTSYFYRQLFLEIPSEYRPQIVRIQYASPGFIQLTELAFAAGLVVGIVKGVCSAIDTANTTYRNIQKGTTQNELDKIALEKEKMDLTQKQIEFCENSILPFGALSHYIKIVTLRRA